MAEGTEATIENGRRYHQGIALMTRAVHGTVRGKIIELDEELGVADGQHVEVEVRAVEPAQKWGEGILRTAGALSDDPHWDEIMQVVHDARKVERQAQGPLE
jgi:hypothetical protein